MSVNKAKPHLLVIPEDDANAQLAKGFHLRITKAERQLQVLPAAGGWSKAVESLVRDHLAGLRKYASRHVLLLIDFDQDATRFQEVQSQIPESLRDRVFLLGVWSEPEELKSSLGRIESIGERLAQECQTDALGGTWAHALLKHNLEEARRLRAIVRGTFF
jgi:hypothetical protein